MPSPPNITNIPAPRVPIIDERTGLISREWYRFFFNLFNLTGSGSNDVSIQDLLVGPPVGPDEQVLVDQRIDGLLADPNGLAQESQIAELQKQVEALSVQETSLVSQLSELQKQVEGLELQAYLTANPTTSFSPISPESAPVTKTADFTVAENETWFINNKTGSTCTVTLPAASTVAGRYLVFQNYQAQFLVSASSNVVPLGGGAAGTAILENAVGNWATMVSDGTNWVIMQDAPNNALLLE
jgi:hypothetical protein